MKCGRMNSRHTCNQRLQRIVSLLEQRGKVKSSLLVGNPAETAEHKQAPLVTAHSNILDSAVDHLRLA